MHEHFLCIAHAFSGYGDDYRPIYLHKQELFVNILVIFHGFQDFFCIFRIKASMRAVMGGQDRRE